MRSLLLKDIFVQKRMLKFLVLYLPLLIISFQSLGEMQVGPIIIAVTYLLTLTSCAYDDKNNTDALLNSLPLTRRAIVLSKYISTWLNYLVVSVAYMLVSFVLGMLPLPAPLVIYRANPLGLLVAAVSLGFLLSIYLPIFFKVGLAKSKIINFLLFFTLFAGFGSVVGWLSSRYDAPPWITGLISGEYSAGIVAFVLIGGIVLLQGISVLVATAFYSRRQF